MKFFRRLVILVAVACLIHVSAAAVACAQGANPKPVAVAGAREPNPQYDKLFTKARDLNSQQLPDKALDAYRQVKDSNSHDPNIASEALYRAALLGYHALVADNYDPHKPLDAAGEEKEKALLNLGNKAHDAVKQLLAQYDTTPAALAANAPTFGPKSLPLKEAIERQIDLRNSQYFTYKLIDALVAMTGRIPSFSYWFALIFIAIVVKTITLPLTIKTYRSQREMQRLQPLVKELQAKYKGKPAEMNEKMMALYKEHKVNPFATCLPMLIQLPFMWWVYAAIRLYEFHFANGTFLWIGSSLSHRYPGILAANLAQFDYILLTIYALSNYLTMKLTPTTDPSMAAQQKQMSIFMTIFLFWMFIQYKWSAAFMLYWLVLNLIGAWQQYTYIFKPNRLKMANGEIILPAPSSGAEDNRAESGRVVTQRAAANGMGKSTPVTAPAAVQARSRPRRKPRR